LTSTNARKVVPYLTLITAALAATIVVDKFDAATGIWNEALPPAHDTAAANAAVVVAAIVASIPGIITEAAALLPAAVAIPQRSSQRLCSKWRSGSAGAQ
jgi:hypothetical protein